jgi:ribose/xylose/arabinose/galactoside ABC-type transport system permease subunit
MLVDPNWFIAAGGVMIVAVIVFEAWMYYRSRK